MTCNHDSYYSSNNSLEAESGKEYKFNYCTLRELRRIRKLRNQC